MVDLTPVTLEGRHVRLEPLSREHGFQLAMVALDSDLWRFTPTQIHSTDDLDAYIGTALSWQRAGTAIPFATVDRSPHPALLNALEMRVIALISVESACMMGLGQRRKGVSPLTLQREVGPRGE